MLATKVKMGDRQIPENIGANQNRDYERIITYKLNEVEIAQKYRERGLLPEGVPHKNGKF